MGNTDSGGADGMGAAYLKAPPEKEYTVHDCCYPTCSGGGHQKIRLYKDDIAFEQTCGGCPWVFHCCVPAPFSWALHCVYANSSSVTRVPYRDLKGVYLDQSKGCCPGNSASPGANTLTHTPNAPCQLNALARRVWAQDTTWMV